MAYGVLDNEILPHIIQIIKKHAGDTVAVTIGTDTALDAIQIDSMDMLEIIFMIEEKYDVHISDDMIGDVDTVGHLSDRLAEHIKSAKQI